MEESPEKCIDCITSNVELIGVQLIANFFKRAISMFNLPVISIGSGCAALEKTLEEILGIQIICIDPDPLSYSPVDKIFIPPQYSTVEDMIKEKSEYIDNCILFICNAEPVVETHDFTAEESSANIPYDYNAVHLLKPKVIISIYDPIDGIAGSHKFRGWVESNENRILHSITYYTPLTSGYIEHDRIILLLNTDIHGYKPLDQKIEMVYNNTKK